MSLVAVYDALKEAKVSDHKATAAIEALEANRDEQRLRNIEERLRNVEERVGELRADMNAQIGELRIDMEKRFGETREQMARLEWMCRANMILISACLALIIGVLLRVIFI